MATGNFVNGNDVATFVLETDAPYTILDFDQGLCAMTGYSPREISNKICTLDNLLYVEDFAETIASINYQLSISNLISVQHRIVTKPGNTLTVLCNGQAFSLPDGRDVLQCVFTDITNLETAASESKQAKTDLEIFANTVPSGVSKHLLDNNLTLTWANNYFYNMCGLSKEQYELSYGKNALSIVYEDDLATVVDALADLTETSQSVIVNYRIKCSDSSLKWVNAIFARSGEISDNFPVVNLVMSDITNLKVAEMKAALEEQKYLIIADISEELPYEYDIAEDTFSFADKFTNIFDAPSVISKPSQNIYEYGLIPEDSREAFDDLLYQVKIGTEYYFSEFKMNTRNGGAQWYYTTFSTIYDEDGSALRVVGLLRNINNQKLEQQKLLQKAEIDLATGLLNKATTEQKIMESLRQVSEHSYSALMLVDIDDFKKVNDTFGHLKGDEVIINVANALNDSRGDFGIAGRLGGDEFCMFFTNVLDTTVVTEKAAHIANRLREQYPGDNNDCKITLSIGIAFTNEQIPYDVMLENADTALYQAKLNGKNCYFCYDSDMQRAEYSNPRTNNQSQIDDIKNKFFTDFLYNISDTVGVSSAIDKAIATIGDYFAVDEIDIWEYNNSKSFVDCTHQWCGQDVEPSLSLKQHTPSTALEELNIMGSDGFVYFSDTSLVQLNSASMNPRNNGIKKFVQGAITFHKRTIGYICLNSMKEDTTWSVQDLATFKIILKVLAETVCLKKSQYNLTKLRQDTMNSYNAISNPIIVVDYDNFQILYHNEAAKEFFPDISLTATCHDAICKSHTPCRDCPIHRLRTEESVILTRHNDEINDYIDLTYAPIRWSTGINTFLVTSSMHKQTKSEYLKQTMEQNISIEKRIAEASYRDIVTGYPNFEKFKVTAQSILNTNSDTDYVMFYFNIKSFKYINETYGHTVGDRTIKMVADVLSKYVHEEETFARIIGDTFIMLLKAKGNNSFMDTFTNIRNEVHDACRSIQDKFNVDLITGILIIDETMHNYEINKLIDRVIMTGKSVDMSLGFSYAFYDDDYHKMILNEAQIENSMQSALEDQEFCAYVQPKYDICTNSLIGGELLVRWLSPSKGFLEPAAFIPSFEKNGFIVNIDFFMIEQACKALRRYLDTDMYVLPFSVNLSRITLAHPNFLNKVRAIVDKYYIPHHYIEFEITESIFSENYVLMIDVLKDLKSMDFIINMDDFGTGYSSLTLLKDLPIDVIKLDHDFLARSTANDKNAICILKSIIEMSHALDIRVVSEGIETADQLEMLKSINCEIGQGFLFAKPMPIDDYGRLLSDYIAEK